MAVLNGECKKEKLIIVEKTWPYKMWAISKISRLLAS